MITGSKHEEQVGRAKDTDVGKVADIELGNTYNDNMGFKKGGIASGSKDGFDW